MSGDADRLLVPYLKLLVGFPGARVQTSPMTDSLVPWGSRVNGKTRRADIRSEA